MKYNGLEEIVFSGLGDIELSHMFDCGQCFRWDENEDGSYTGMAGSYVCRAELLGGRERSDAGEAELRLLVSGGSEEFWRNYFDLDTDYRAMKKKLADRDPKLVPAMESGYGIRILRQDFWEVLISFIVSQNNNIPRIKKCITSLARNYGRNVGEFFGEERWSFPDPDELGRATPDELADLRLGYRNTYICDAVPKFREDGVPEGSSAEMRKELLSYKGVGPKVANCILLFGLRDFAAFPIDVWVRKLMNDMYGFDEKDLKGMQSFASEHFRELGGIAQQYLFFYYRGK
jgi:N-glycosylase/DNA lyase